MTIYYKAFNRDMTCRGFQFKEGETYTVDGAPVLCKHGFHFCTDLALTFQYYTFNVSPTENLYAEVEVVGDCIFEQPTLHKGCTNSIKILRVLSDTEVLELLDRCNNSGDRNSGYYNSGYRNSGNYNSGDRNSGNWNS